MSNGERRRVVILGAAGRDFHNFNVRYRDDPASEVVAFTATQIPGIDGRRYPAELSGSLYPDGIPILDEAELEGIIRDQLVDVVVFSYSDVTHQTVMHLASRALAAGADFELLGPASTMLRSTKPVLSVCAVRTGCGKSQTSRYLAQLIRDRGHRLAVVRHPMPYGDLAAQRVQRFASMQDMVQHDCTVEEREEYEPYVQLGIPIYAGVDYGEILRQAELEADVILWDGGNNDIPFYRSSLEICLADPHRAGHETRYHPGEVNARRADVLVINKVDSAPAGAVEQLRASLAEINPAATIVLAESVVEAEDAQAIRGSRVLCVEDGPTLTHGEMPFGAGQVAADRFGAAEVVDPRAGAQGSIRQAFARYATLGNALPALGYGDVQLRELEASINAIDCDLVLIATPIDLGQLIRIDRPSQRIHYRYLPAGEPSLAQALDSLFGDDHSRRLLKPSLSTGGVAT